MLFPEPELKHGLENETEAESKAESKMISIAIEETVFTPQIAAALAVLHDWIQKRVSSDAVQWYRQQCQLIAEEGRDSTLFKAMGLAARKLGKADLCLDAVESEQASALRPGFDPANWSVDIAARVGFILSSFHGNEQDFSSRLDDLADSAEINELIALYSGFALYPVRRAIEHRAREAIRSSMRPVFEAMAHRNPYPMEEFDEAAWNQMVVKSFFLDSPLWPVQGLEKRANPALARILVDLAHERWAAGRQFNPELWRCISAHADDHCIAALLHALDSACITEKLAIGKSLPNIVGSGRNPSLALVRARCEELDLMKQAAMLSWQALHERFLQKTDQT